MSFECSLGRIWPITSNAILINRYGYVIGLTYKVNVPIAGHASIPGDTIRESVIISFISTIINDKKIVDTHVMTYVCGNCYRIIKKTNHDASTLSVCPDMDACPAIGAFILYVQQLIESNRR